MSNFYKWTYQSKQIVCLQKLDIKTLIGSQVPSVHYFCYFEFYFMLSKLIFWTVADFQHGFITRNSPANQYNRVCQFRLVWGKIVQVDDWPVLISWKDLSLIQRFETIRCGHACVEFRTKLLILIFPIMSLKPFGLCRISASFIKTGKLLRPFLLRKNPP